MAPAEWLQLHCRKLFLRNISVLAHIGIHDFEKQGVQRLLIDVDLYVPLHATTPANDSLHEVVDYDFVREHIQSRIARGPIGLQETLCDDLLNALLQNPGVVAARVATRKPDVYPDCDAVGVDTFRMRENTTR